MLGILSIISTHYQNIACEKLKTRTAMDINMHLLEHVKRFPMKFFIDKNPTYINQRLNMDSNDVVIFLINDVLQLITNILNIGVAVIIMILINMKIALLLTLLIPIYVFLYLVFKRLFYATRKEFVEHQNLFFSSILIL